MTAKKRRKSKYPKKKNMYFTQVHEDAILEYCKSESKARREELYGTLIQPAFDELVDKIVYTYKFNSLPNCDILKEDCKVFLVTILEKFDVEKGYKAFTYFSVITKNWFIAETKKRKKKLQKEVALDVSDTMMDEKLIVRNTYIQDRTKAEFIEVLHEEIVWWKEETSSAQDRKILEAVEVLFESLLTPIIAIVLFFFRISLISPMVYYLSFLIWSSQNFLASFKSVVFDLDNF